MKLTKADIIDLDIKSLAYGGMGIAMYNNIVIFVKGAIPGEKVKAKIYKKKKKYLEAYVVEKIKPSKNQVEPKCIHFGVCGGCSFQNLNYNTQLEEKYKQVENLFEKMGNMTNPPIKNIIGVSEKFNYRNKMEFSYSSNRWIVNLDEEPKDSNQNALGLHVKGRYDKIVDIDSCEINGVLANKIFQFLKKCIFEKNIEPFNIKERTGLLRNIILREGHKTSQVLINFITTKPAKNTFDEIISLLTNKFPEIKSIINTVVKPNSGSSIGEEEKVLWGEDFIFDEIGKLKYKISSNSFFQTNTIQSKTLYEQIVKSSNFNGQEIVYDLYCGTGSIGLFLAKYVKKVYGVEIVTSAVMDAIENANNNQINNIEFFNGDLIDFFDTNKEFKLIEKPDVLILDPPRAGIHKNTIKNLINLNPKKIIYVSCNPSTQVRDVNILSEYNFITKNIQPIDMFPHTPHIENIVTLEKNDK
tara:strand:+ start:1556 stop:2965 length:1410 start_codon:yes stop_codon:yes gene_type:complete